ncbi:MAG: NAD(P)H-dependent glycerol-3-phosphate dehydrogenase [Bacteroidota bacterium]
MNIGVIGDGSWATAIIKLLSNNAARIHWYVREKSMLDFIRDHHHNPIYLSSVEFDPDIVKPSGDILEVINRSDVIFFVIPSAFFPGTIEKTGLKSFRGKTIVSAIKGIIPGENITISGYFRERGVETQDYVFVSGPCHAEEVAMERLSYLTLASENNDLAGKIASLLSCRYIKTVLSKDVGGTEYSSVLKNIMAIAVGISTSMGYGDNFNAVLVSNAIREMKRFLDKIHPAPRDIDASVYLGDLAVTAYSPFSRNRTLGAMIGKGYSVNTARIEMNMIAEGYYGTKSIREIYPALGIDMPITDAVYNILYEGISPYIELKLLADKLT